MGWQALFSNETGIGNTALGVSSLDNNISGVANTAIGRLALSLNETGHHNTALGYVALNLSIGEDNTAIGSWALANLLSGDNNIGIGRQAQVPNSSGSNQIRMGNDQIQIACIQVPWDCTSDKRWKDEIRELPYGLAFIEQLKPVDYIRKNNEDKTREIGFIAQDVEDLLAEVGYTDQGFLHKDDEGYMSLRYNDFIALLTKAIQEQQEIIEEQDNEIKSMKSELVENNIEQELINKRLTQLEERLNTSQQ
jgi:hypothetical protein